MTLSIGLSIVFLGTSIAVVYLLALSLDIQIGFAPLILIVPTVALTGLIPVAVNGIGVKEAGFVFLFAMFGVSEEYGLAVAILFRVCAVVPSLVGGPLYATMGLSVKEFTEKQPGERSHGGQRHNHAA